jgi:hypothetical protein
MRDSNENLLAAVDHLDDAAASLRRSDVHPTERAALLRLIADAQRMIEMMAAREPERRTA